MGKVDFQAAGGDPGVRTFRTTYYAVPIPRLLELLREAGFVGVERTDGAFFQPLLLARREGKER